MSIEGENQTAVEEVVTEEGSDAGQKEVTQKEPSAVEKRALEMGWRPKDSFDGEEDDFIDAQEFVRRKPLFEKIDNVGKELKETRKALKALQVHHQLVKETEYQNALAALKTEKKAALEAGDADRLIEIDDKIADEKANQLISKRQEQQQVNTPHPNFVQWVGKNPWYKENAELRSVADQVGTAYAGNNPDKDPDEVLKYVESRIKKLYPETFSNPNKTRPSAVEGSTSTSGSRKPKDDINDYPLTDDERKVMMTFVRQGVMTKEQYITDLKQVKGQ